jgi:hypothetical protein
MKFLPVALIALAALPGALPAQESTVPVVLRVVDGELGTPVAGASVTILPGGHVVATDSAGEFRMPAVGGSELTFVTVASGFIADSTTFTVLDAPDCYVELYRDLPRAAKGRALNAVSDKPVAAAIVAVLERDASVRTGHDGGYLVRFPAGENVLRASSKGLFGLPVALQVNGGDTAVVDLYLYDTTLARGSISGHVTDAKTGGPLVGVDVEVVNTDSYVVTGEEGEYALTDIVPGRYVVKVLYPGRTFVDKTVRVPAGGSIVVDFAMEPGWK